MLHNDYAAFFAAAARPCKINLTYSRVKVVDFYRKKKDARQIILCQESTIRPRRAWGFFWGTERRSGGESREQNESVYSEFTQLLTQKNLARPKGQSKEPFNVSLDDYIYTQRLCLPKKWSICVHWIAFTITSVINSMNCWQFAFVKNKRRKSLQVKTSCCPTWRKLLAGMSVRLYFPV